MFVEDDWPEHHHDVELMNATGRRLAKARLPPAWRTWPGFTQ
ncbi:hypothetical protein [Nonomuraea sp. KM90]